MLDIVQKFASTDKINKFYLWKDEQSKQVVEMQRKNSLAEFPDKFLQRLNDKGIPYYGASGGELTYSFTPTSLGMIVSVRHGVTKQEFDFTDYDSW